MQLIINSLVLLVVNSPNSIIMKLSAFSLLFSLIVSNVFGQRNQNYVQLSPKITTEIKTITGFDKIEVSEDFEVFIRFSEKEEIVKIEANENLHKLIQVEKEGETLKISTKSYSTVGPNYDSSIDEKLVAYITVKNLEVIKGDEDVVIELVDKLETEDLSIYLDEDSTLKGHLDVHHLKVEIDEDSVLEINGSAHSMDVESREDSIIKGIEFEVENLNMDLREESEAKLTVNGTVKLVARNESSFYYGGEPVFITKRVSGESEVISQSNK